MKVINEGRTEHRPWWVGRSVVCPQCGRVLQLEEGDEKDPNVRISGDLLLVTCDRCEATMK